MTDFLGLIEKAQGAGTMPMLAWLSNNCRGRDEKRE
jgi:hypothetical protein